MVSIVTALSYPDNPSEHPPPRDKGGTCTCTYSSYPDIDCPIHGLEAHYERADQTLDIDTSYQGEEA